MINSAVVRTIFILLLLAGSGLSEGCAIRTQRVELVEVPLRVEDVTVDRVDSETLRVRWPADFASGSVAIYKGPRPNEIDRGEPVAVGSGYELVVDDLDDDVPHYLELVPDGNGSGVIASERRLPLEGALNFRDLGGYQTTDGRRVRWGKVFRADSLGGLTEDDLRYLDALGIRLICDFRSETERTEDPSRYESESLNLLNLPVSAEGVDPTIMRRKIRTGGVVPLELERTMQHSYRLFVTDFSDDWAEMFRLLLEPKNLPAVVHCTKGKDRTGFASALVLLALGVPEETVFEDYMLSNLYLSGFTNFVLRWVPLYSFFRTDPDDLLPLLEARRSYLQGSLDAIVARHGSVDEYLENRLGVTPADRERLREILLAPPLSPTGPEPFKQLVAKEKPRDDPERPASNP